MIWWNRIKNIWAWSAYNPTTNPPDELGFSWTSIKKAVNQKEINPKKLKSFLDIEPIQAHFIPRVKISPAEQIINEPDTV